jgi:hypothetical protein
MPASIDVCGLVVVRQRNGKEARSNPHRVQTGHGMITDSVALEAPKAP